MAASDCLTTGSVRTDLRGGDAQGKCLSVPSSSLNFTVTLHRVSSSFLPQSALPSHNAGIVHFKGCSSGYEVIPSLRGARDVSNPRRAEPGAAGGGYAGKNLSGPRSKIKRGQNTTNFQQRRDVVVLGLRWQRCASGRGCCSGWPPVRMPVFSHPARGQCTLTPLSQSLHFTIPNTPVLRSLWVSQNGLGCEGP